MEDHSTKLLNETLTHLLQQFGNTPDPINQNKVLLAVQELQGVVSTLDGQVKQAHNDLESQGQQKSKHLRQLRKRRHNMVEHEKHAQLQCLYSSFHQWVQHVTSDDPLPGVRMQNQLPHRSDRTQNRPPRHVNQKHHINNLHSSRKDVRPMRMPPRPIRIRRPTNIPELRNAHARSTSSSNLCNIKMEPQVQINDEY
eukprot:157851_1